MRVTRRMPWRRVSSGVRAGRGLRGMWGLLWRLCVAHAHTPLCAVTRMLYGACAHVQRLWRGKGWLVALWRCMQDLARRAGVAVNTWLSVCV